MTVSPFGGAPRPADEDLPRLIRELQQQITPGGVMSARRCAGAISSGVSADLRGPIVSAIEETRKKLMKHPVHSTDATQILAFINEAEHNLLDEMGSRAHQTLFLGTAPTAPVPAH